MCHKSGEKENKTRPMTAQVEPKRFPTEVLKEETENKLGNNNQELAKI